MEVPTLSAWKLSVAQSEAAGSGRGLGRGGAVRHRRIMNPEAAMDGEFESDHAEAMEDVGSYITSKGHLSATYRVPGLISIPADGSERTFTITQLNLDADMSWICVPKVDPKVHLNARIQNSSEYTLLPGRASIYVDGSFISRTSLKGVSPKETFDCPLG